MLPEALGVNYYLEYLDPKHRKPELKLFWLSSATTKNFFAWIKDYGKKNSLRGIEKVIYFSPDEQEYFHVLTKDHHAYLPKSEQPVADGRYLYVFTFTQELYIRDEHKLNGEDEIILSIEHQIINYMLSMEKYEIVKQSIISTASESKPSFWSRTAIIKINNECVKVTRDLAEKYQLLMEIEDAGDWQSSLTLNN